MSLAVISTSLVASGVTSAEAACATGLTPVACENTLPGSPSSEWEVSGAGDSSIQGFSTDISVNVGSTISFKIDTDATEYDIDVYRLGYYGGDGARRVATVSPSAALPQVQPPCLTDPSVLLTDCGNWAVSASWQVPADAVSGVYIAKLTRPDTGGASHIPFIVRDDASRSALLFQTSDTTWQAYNQYGGSNFYPGGAGRAQKLSYNRPFTTRDDVPWGRDYLFANEYPMIRFLERNGYDVSYISGIDTDRFGSLLLNHETFLSVGHDEYWSGRQRANVEAARDAGVNLAFFAGNDVYWRTRYEASIDGSATDYRTIVCYKETWSNAKVDPSSEWTGTWRDPRFASAAQGGGLPENALVGTAYMVNHDDLPLTVPAADGKLRIWRNTPVANLAAGATATVAPHIVGYESNEDLDNGFRPAGLFRMSTTTGAVPEYLKDFGTTVGPGETTHAITMYKAPSGARVFSAGTIQWSWGLDAVHDADSPVDTVATVSPAMQQATINLLADLDAQPTTLMPGMVAASKTTDTTPPTVSITSPAANASLPHGAQVTVTGTASDIGGRVGGVEVSMNGGRTWHPASGRETWAYTGRAEGSGVSSIKVRAVDDSANLMGTPASVGVSVTCPCSVFGGADPALTGGAASGDATPLELGMRVTPRVDGVVLGVRFYKGAANTGTHTGSLWSASGQLLARGTFTGETASGWQELRFATPVQVDADTTYVVSYWAPNGNYHAKSEAFYTPLQMDPLTVPASTAAAPNGVFATSNAFPTNTFKAGNYYVDVVFQDGDPVPPAPLTTTPAVGSTSADPAGDVQIRFNEALSATGLAASVTPSGSTTPVPATVSVSTTGTGRSAVSTVVIDPTASLAAGTVHTVSVLARDLGGNQMTAPYTFTFRTGRALTTPGTCPCGFFEDRVPSGVQATTDRTPVELGVRFAPTARGVIRGIQFYKDAADTGPHTVTLWTESGTQLAQSAVTGESTTGWQEALFTTPVTVVPGTTYIAAYRTTTGAFSYTANGFGSGLTSGPLFAPSDAGAFTYTVGGLPATASTTNYWVDVVFDQGPLALAATSPLSGDRTADPALTAVTATFDRPIDTATTRSATLTSGGTVVPATVTWQGDDGSGAGSVSLVPATALRPATTYEVTVTAKDLSGNGPAAPLTWTFTTGSRQDGTTCACGLFDDVTPAGFGVVADPTAVELGVTFSPDRDGSVTGIQFLKPPGMTGTHVVSLWDAAGNRLATATATDESATGWQTVALPSPVAVTAGGTYTASFTSPSGRYAFDSAGLSSALSRPPLSTPALGGAFTYTAGAFPTNRSTTNYFVDVVLDGTTVPAPWRTTSSVPATTTYRDGEYTLSSAGADIWVGVDDYAAVYTPTAAKAGSAVTARVVSQTVTDPWAKAGVVLRNSVPGARTSPGYAVMVLTPGNGVAFQWDSNGNGDLDSWVQTATGTSAPVWLRLVRVSATQVAGLYSLDGVVWTQVGSTVTVPGAAALQDAGIVMTSHNATVAGAATFSDLQIRDDVVLTRNVALNRPATQSSTYLGAAPASRAVDGNTDGNYNGNSVSHTNPEANPWWQVDLGANVSVRQVVLWNRTDCCADRLNDAVVMLSRTDMTGRTYAQLQADTTVIKIPIGIVSARSIPLTVPAAAARYVRVQLPGTNALQLAEVQVMATAPNPAMALAGTAPPAGSAGVDPGTTVTGTFNQPIDVNGARAATLTAGGTAVPATVTWTADDGTGRGSVRIAPAARLAAATLYTVTVNASDSLGNTAPTPFTWTFTTAGPPGAPGAVTAAAGDGSVSVSWQAPTATGGLPVASYSATASPGGASCTATAPATSCTIAGLSNGLSYSVAVTATNAAGRGAAATSATVTPYPASIMTASATSLWLDGADTSRLFTSSTCTGATAAAGGTVGCWADKSAKANNAVQTTASARAARSTLNGRSAPLFDGSSDAYTLDVTKLPTGTAPSAIYVVATQEDSLAGLSCFRHAFAYGAASTGASRTVEKGCRNSRAYLDTYNTWSSMSPTRTWPVNSATLFDGVVTGTGVRANLNGALNYTYTGATNTGTSAGARIGTSPWSGGFWRGRIAEVVVLSATPTAAENRAIQEYLARKWGITISPAAP